MMMTWMVNDDREPLQGGSATARSRTKTFPYEASPNAELQTVADGADLAASPDQVWPVIGQFGNLMWHPLAASEKLTGAGVGQLRTIETIDGKQIIERLEMSDNSQRLYRYTNVDHGLGVVDYTGTSTLEDQRGAAARGVARAFSFLPTTSRLLL